MDVFIFKSIHTIILSVKMAMPDSQASVNVTKDDLTQKHT